MALGGSCHYSYAVGLLVYSSDWQLPLQLRCWSPCLKFKLAVAITVTLLVSLSMALTGSFHYSYAVGFLVHGPRWKLPLQLHCWSPCLKFKLAVAITVTLLVSLSIVLAGSCHYSYTVGLFVYSSGWQLPLQLRCWSPCL